MLRYVYEILNAFIVLQVEPKKLASVVKPKTRRALGIVVDFVVDGIQHIGQTFISKIWVFRSRFQQSKLFHESLCEVCVKNLDCR